MAIVKRSATLHLILSIAMWSNMPIDDAIGLYQTMSGETWG